MDTSQPWLLYVYVGGFGIAFGSRAVILSAITADIFAGRGFGTIFGFSVMSVGVGGGLGAWLGGALHDLTGDYVVSFNVANSLLLISVLAVWVTGLGLDAPLRPATVAGSWQTLTRTERFA